jgi:16S rRNA processing protein RimM
MDSDLLLIGKVGKPHGLRGDVKVHSRESSYESLSPGLRVYLGRGQEAKEQILSEVKVQSQTLICRFQGLDNRNQAEELYGSSIYIDKKDLKSLPKGEYYWYQLTGSRVYDHKGLFLGLLEEVFTTAAHDVWVIKDGENEKLFPAVDDVILAVDPSRKEIRIRDLYDPFPGDDR